MARVFLKDFARRAFAGPRHLLEIGSALHENGARSVVDGLRHFLFRRLAGLGCGLVGGYQLFQGSIGNHVYLAHRSGLVTYSSWSAPPLTCGRE